MAGYIAQSSTHKFHRALGPKACFCNSRNRGLSVRGAHVRTVARARPEHFCVKCFSGNAAKQAIALATFFLGEAKGEPAPAKSEIRVLWEKFIEADEGWNAAIKAAFPKEWVGDVRYIPRGKGEPGSPLAAAYAAKLEADRVFEAAGGFKKFFEKQEA